MIIFQSVLRAFLCDVFLHMPRGSNNRINEGTSARSNANRLFDSQNNNNGGYNVADSTSKPAHNEDGHHKAIYFQSGKSGKSELGIEWWNQHGCGKQHEYDSNWIDCQIIVQYMCQDSVTTSFKNGVKTAAPAWSEPKAEESFEQITTRKTKDKQRKPSSGEHEPWEYYDACYARGRNRNLFLADQNRQSDKGATRTRQNPAGTRRGYECPEERDYFPYWHPSPWTDIAILTSQPNNCPFYKQESFNRKAKHECVQYILKFVSNRHESGRKPSSANNEKDCIQLGGHWTAFHNYLEIIPNAVSISHCKNKAKKINKVFGEDVIWAVPYLDGPSRYQIPVEQCLILPQQIECNRAPWTRANHLGHTKSDNLPNYKWTLPHFEFIDEPKECILRIRYNISSNDYPEDYDKPREKTYYSYQHLANDPIVELYPKLQLQLAINTAQIGRTFQDRTHIFQIHARPTTLPDEANLYNIGVRGRRGNIQQTFPAVEYDFTPNSLSLSPKDFIHIQWEGSNTQPVKLAGQGLDRTDRHNMVSLDRPNWNIPQGRVVADDVKIFNVKYKNRQEIYEYRTINNVNIFDTRHLCAQYGMQLPEPKDQTFNDALRTLWMPNGKWKGMIFLGISDEKNEGNFKYSSNRRNIEYENWFRRRPNNGNNNEHYAAMFSSGKWDDVNVDQRTANTICIKRHIDHKPIQSINMFQNAEWIWSAVTKTKTKLMNSNENLIIQMASSGYYQ